MTIASSDPGRATRRPSLLMVSTVAATIEGFLLPYAEHYRQHGWRVDAAASGASTDSTLNAAFDRTHELPLSRSILDVAGLLRGMNSISQVLRDGYDVVHVHTPIAGFVTRAAIRRMPAANRPAVVYTAHGFHFHEGGSRTTNALFLTAEKVAGRWTDRLVVINAEDHSAALTHRIVSQRRLIFMPGIGVDTGWYSRASVSDAAIAEARASLGIGPDTPVMAVVGELSIRKRPFDVVAALGMMRHRDCHLVLLGDGPEQARVEAAIREVGAEDRVHLLGGVADIRPMVAASSALVLASSREGLPRSIMEALLLEVPVVASDTRGNPDLVLPDAGYIVPVGDVSALAGAMDRILDDPREARAMGANGRARMVERYDLSVLIRMHDGMYADLQAERTTRS